MTVFHLAQIYVGRLLAQMGPTPEAFSFRQPYPSPANLPVSPILDKCA